MMNKLLDIYNVTIEIQKNSNFSAVLDSLVGPLSRTFGLVHVTDLTESTLYRLKVAESLPDANLVRTFFQEAGVSDVKYVFNDSKNNPAWFVPGSELNNYFGFNSGL